MIKSVVFDMGGTLEDIVTTPESALRCGERMLEHLALHGIALPYDASAFMDIVIPNSDAYRTWSLGTLRELMPFEQWSQWRFKGIEMDQDLLRAISEELMFIWETTYFDRNIRPDAADVLRTLKGMGYRMGVISNTGTLTQVYHTLDLFGIRQYFDAVCLSSISGFRKPHPILFEVTARNLGCAPPECAYVGDTLTRDVIGSRRAGYGLCVRIGSHLTQISDAQIAVKDDERTDADHVIESLTELIALLSRPAPGQH